MQIFKQKNAQVRRNCNRQTRRLSLENLERREMLAPLVWLDGGDIRIDGTVWAIRRRSATAARTSR